MMPNNIIHLALSPKLEEGRLSNWLMKMAEHVGPVEGIALVQAERENPIDRAVKAVTYRG